MLTTPVRHFPLSSSATATATAGATSSSSSSATPPSPPVSDTYADVRKSVNTSPGFARQRASGAELNPRSVHGPRAHHKYTGSRTSLGHNVNGRSTISSSRANNYNNNVMTPTSKSSESLNQIRGLIGKMQKLEERVQSAKSRMPAPSESPSQTRSGSVTGTLPSTVTMRRKRLSASQSPWMMRGDGGDTTPSVPPQGRASFGFGDSRPSSRTSYSSRSSFSQSSSFVPLPRPESRQSTNGSRIMPLGFYSTPVNSSSLEGQRRSRSSLSNGHLSPVGKTNEDGAATPVTIRSRQPQDPRRPSLTNVNGVTRMRSVSGIPTPQKRSIPEGQKKPLPGLG